MGLKEAGGGRMELRRSGASMWSQDANRSLELNCTRAACPRPSGAGGCLCVCVIYILGFGEVGVALFFTAVKYTCCRLNVCVPCKICTLESDVICPLAAGSLSIMFSRSSHTVSVLCSCFWHTGVQASVYIPALGAMSVRYWPLGAPGRGYTQVIDSSLDKS